MQKLMIFLGRDTLSVAEVRCGVETKYKSVGGKISTKYNDFEQIDKFVEELRNTFNVDAFADDSFDILIVSCGAEQEAISKLFALCQGAEHLNIVDVAKVLPWLVWNKKQLKAGEKIVVQFASLSYEVACDEKKLITCVGCDGKAELEVSVADFAMLFYMDVSKMVGGDSEELKQIKKLLATTETSLGKQLKEQTNLASKLSVEVDKKKNKIAELEKTIIELKEKLPPGPSEIQKQIIEKIKRFKDRSKLLGTMYIKGEIPKQKLDTALQQISKCGKELSRSVLNGIDYSLRSFGEIMGAVCSTKQSSNYFCPICSFRQVHVSESDVLALVDCKSKFGAVYLFTSGQLFEVHECDGSIRRYNTCWKYDEIDTEKNLLADPGLMSLVKELQTKV